jgi:acetolactate synthase I/II/III large subunit
MTATGRWPTGGDAVVRALECAGVEVAFGVVSIHNIPIFDAMGRSGIRLVPTRNEAGAVNMADGYARASGGIGAAITSTGTGAGNAAGACIEALSASSRVLHVTGQIESKYIGRNSGYIHETKDQLGMLDAVSKRALRTIRGKVGVTVAEALQSVVEFPQGPVSVEIPIDVQQEDAELVEFDLKEPFRPEPDRGQIRKAAELVRAASRPVFWAGGGCRASGAEEALGELIERTGAALLTSNNGRGVISEEHPQCIGNFGNQLALQDFLAQADLLVSVGTQFRSNETLKYRMPVPEDHIQIDIDPEAPRRNLRVSHPIVGDARLSLDALNEALETFNPDRAQYRAEISQVKTTAHEKGRAALEPYDKIVDELIEWSRPDDVLVRDVTISSSTWGNRLYPIRDPNTNIFAVGGGIGQGLQMALGAKLAVPERRVIGIVGDGGLVVNLGEMLTAAQEGIRMVLLLFDDKGYGVLRNLQDARFDGRRVGVDLFAPDFEALARTLGWKAVKVTSVEEFRPALDECGEAGRPATIVVDMESIGDMARPFVPPI